jgi:hypothetical protein
MHSMQNGVCGMNPSLRMHFFYGSYRIVSGNKNEGTQSQASWQTGVFGMKPLLRMNEDLARSRLVVAY